jgi:hypothetical protein
MRATTVEHEDTTAPVDTTEAPIRWDLVARIRREIADGIYDTPEKMEAALRKLRERME